MLDNLFISVEYILISDISLKLLSFTAKHKYIPRIFQFQIIVIKALIGKVRFNNENERSYLAYIEKYPVISEAIPNTPASNPVVRD